MNFFTVLLHLCQFALPAVFVGGFVAVFSPTVLRLGPNRTHQKIIRQWFINSLVGVAALSIGLFIYSVDGKMMTYALMVVSCAASQWFQQHTASGAGRK